MVVIDRLVEARPAGAGLEFGRGIEQQLPAADALVDAVVLGVPVFAGEGALGAFLTRDAELLRRELFTPLRFGFLDAFAHGHTDPCLTCGGGQMPCTVRQET